MVDINNFISTSTIESEQYIEFFPVTPIVSGDLIQFDINKTLTQLTDPSFFLNVTAKVVEKDGTMLKDAANVAPVNLTLHSLFRDVVLKANETILTQSSGTYPYRSYFDTNHTYSKKAKNAAIGLPQMYIKEKSGKFNTISAGMNPSFDKRVKYFAKSKEVHMGGIIHCEFFLQNRFIIPGIKYYI